MRSFSLQESFMPAWWNGCKRLLASGLKEKSVLNRMGQILTYPLGKIRLNAETQNVKN
jgi:hypothetical protein